MSIAIPRLNSGLGLHLKATTRKLASTIRYSYNESVQKSLYYRLVFSLDPEEGDSFWVEYSDQMVFLRTPEETEEFQRKLDRLNQEEREAELAKEPHFTRITEHLNKEVKLFPGIRFRDIYVEHQADRIEEGVAYLYFFPNGHSEKAVINIENDEGEVYSIDVAPLSGKPFIRREYWDYEMDQI